MWVLGVSGAQRELELKAWMEARGVVAYVPMAKHEQRLRHVKKPIVYSKPAFGRYIFMREEGPAIWQHYRAANERGLITAIVCMDGEPVRMPDKAVGRIQLAESQGLFDSVRLPLNFQVGNKVEIIEGAAQGLHGIVQRVHAKTKRVSVEIFGREVNLHISNLLICSHSMSSDDRDDPTAPKT